MVLILSVTACFDVFDWETEVYGPYYVANDPVSALPTLYYRIEQGGAYERFPAVSRVGYAAGYLYLEAHHTYYWFAVQQDKPTDIGDPASAALIHGPLTEAEFYHWLRSRQITQADFQFQD